ncbi:MAG: hypothetical protein QM784_16800 [Polyangiaceae bacterium]
MRNLETAALIGQLVTLGLVLLDGSNAAAQTPAPANSAEVAATKPEPAAAAPTSTAPVAATTSPVQPPSPPAASKPAETIPSPQSNGAGAKVQVAEPVTLPPVKEAPITTNPDAPKVNFGVGLRVQYSYDPKVSGQDFSQDVGTNVRPYISGSANRYVKFQANLDSNFTGTTGNVQVLDAIFKIEVNDFINVWAGRMLPPSDRANLSGPYYQNIWNYPVHANLYPAIYAGRSNGAAYWGQAGGGMFKWQLGMFDLTGTDRPLAAGRLVLNLLDPEPGYYNSSTYYGEKDVLAVGVAGQYQKNGNTALGTGLDGTAASVDLLLEKRLGGSGTLSVEGAYYNFEGTNQGSSFWGLLGYLAPGKQGIGTLQVVARLQRLYPDGGDDYSTFDAGLHYIMNGHAARAALNYQVVQDHAVFDTNQVVTLGGQLQF